ncbi:MAG: hypothetical protein IKS25_05470 [Oscillospiraceae bacterium]|nr:hypothetical protein [Oscillospiraceae bacterium]
MTSFDMLSMLKVDLGIRTQAYDPRLLNYIESAKQAITREGVTLTESAEDSMLVVRYAGWIWRRRDTGSDMPRDLRWALNNRIFSEHMQGGS